MILESTGCNWFFSSCKKILWMGSTTTGANSKLVQPQLVVQLQLSSVQSGSGLFLVHRTRLWSTNCKKNAQWKRTKDWRTMERRQRTGGMLQTVPIWYFWHNFCRLLTSTSGSHSFCPHCPFSIIPLTLVPYLYPSLFAPHFLVPTSASCSLHRDCSEQWHDMLQWSALYHCPLSSIIHT